MNVIENPVVDLLSEAHAINNSHEVEKNACKQFS